MSNDGAIRTTKRRGYTLIYNDMLATGMSARAWGVYCYLLSKPDGWETRIHDLVGVFKEGRDALTAARDELVALGYLRRVEEHDSGLLRIRYLLDGDQEQPPTAQTRRSTPAPGNPDPGNPYPGDPEPVAPDAANPLQVNTYVPTTDSATTEPPGGQVALLPDTAPSSRQAPPAAPSVNDRAKVIATWVYEQTGKGVPYMGAHTIARTLLPDGHDDRTVAHAMVALYRSAKAVKAVTVRQVLQDILVIGPDGKVRPQGQQPPGGSARDAMVDAWSADLARMSGQQQDTPFPPQIGA